MSPLLDVYNIIDVHNLNEDDFESFLENKASKAEIQALENNVNLHMLGSEMYAEDFEEKYAIFKYEKILKRVETPSDVNSRGTINTRGTPCYDNWLFNHNSITAGLITCCGGMYFSGPIGGTIGCGGCGLAAGYAHRQNDRTYDRCMEQYNR